MRTLIGLSTATIALACTSASSPRILTPRQIASAAKPAVVRIESTRASGDKSVGTGFVMSSAGLVATNLHVLVGGGLDRQPPAIEVFTADGRRFAATEFAGVDAARDLVILRIPAQGIATLQLADSDRITVGDPVIAIGNPLGVLDFTVSDGLVSSIRPLSDDLSLIQISAPISQGSSGGPVLNQYGEVIGVATLIAREGQNLNFAVPSNYLRALTQAGEPGTIAALHASLLKLVEGDRPQQQGPAIKRNVPIHDVSLLDGCSTDELKAAVENISKAIRVGAPLYNEGNHEACFRIYEGTALTLERDSACAGVRNALGAGLLAAAAQSDFTAKAWAMRDAFDGLLLVIGRKSQP